MGSLFLLEKYLFFRRFFARFWKVYLTQLQCFTWIQENCVFASALPLEGFADMGKPLTCFDIQYSPLKNGHDNLDHLTWLLWGLNGTIETKVILKLWNIVQIKYSFNLKIYLGRVNVFSFMRVQFSSVQSLSRVQLCETPWIAAHQPSLSITNSRSLRKLTSIESVMPSSHLILCCPLPSCPQSLPESGSFQMTQLFASGGQSTGVSASTSVLPMNTQDWSPLGWTCWILLAIQGTLKVSSNTTVQKHQFFGSQLSL